METVILVLHLIIVVTMVLVILLQRSSKDDLSGLGGGSSNPAGMMAGRGSSNPLTKATSILAAMFVCTSLGLAYLANAKNHSVIEEKIPEIEEKASVPFAADEVPAPVSVETPAKAIEPVVAAPESEPKIPVAK